MLEVNKKKLKLLLKDDKFDALLSYANETIDQWHDENVIGTNEFDTLKLLFTKQGKIDGLKAFLAGLEKETYD